MPNQPLFGPAFVVFCIFILSSTTPLFAQMSIDRLPPETLKKVEERKAGGSSVRLMGPRYKNARRWRANDHSVSRQLVRRQLTGPTYKNRRFQHVRPRVARFKQRR